MADTLTEPQRAWIAALRSGEYKQTTEVLARLDKNGEPVGFCCLGVACDLAVKAGVVNAGVRRQWDGVECLAYCGSSGSGQWTSLPADVQVWLGLNGSAGHYKRGQSLASHNDTGETFERIADIIESKPEGLFS